MPAREGGQGLPQGRARAAEQLRAVLAQSFQEIFANQLGKQFPLQYPSPAWGCGCVIQIFSTAHLASVLPVLPLSLGWSLGCEQPARAWLVLGSLGCMDGEGNFWQPWLKCWLLGDPEVLQHWRLFNSKAKSRCKGVIIPFISLFIPTPTAEHNYGWWLWGSAVTPGLEVAAGDAGAEPGFREGMGNRLAS